MSGAALAEAALPSAFVSIPGLACSTCGSTQLAIVQPGCEALRCALLDVTLRRPAPMLAWCSVGCAVKDARSGWCWAADTGDCHVVLAR